MPVAIKELTVRAGAGSASDIFLLVQAKRAGKIKGESVAPGHADEILVKSWHWAVDGSSAVGSVQATARRSYSGLTITKGIDSASTALMSALATNDEIKEAKLTMRKAGEGQVEYLTITLKGARVSHLDHSVDETGDVREVVTILFTKVEVEYRPQQATGSVGGAFVFQDEILPA
jgi:type VI secretion system secreted protein Hcp